MFIWRQLQDRNTTRTNKITTAQGRSLRQCGLKRRPPTFSPVQSASKKKKNPWTEHRGKTCGRLTRGVGMKTQHVEVSGTPWSKRQKCREGKQEETRGIKRDHNGGNESQEWHNWFSFPCAPFLNLISAATMLISNLKNVTGSLRFQVRNPSHPSETDVKHFQPTKQPTGFPSVLTLAGSYWTKLPFTTTEEDEAHEALTSLKVLRNVHRHPIYPELKGPLLSKHFLYVLKFSKSF